MENEELLGGSPWFASELAVYTTCAIEILDKESISASNSSNHISKPKANILSSTHKFISFSIYPIKINLHKEEDQSICGQYWFYCMKCLHITCTIIESINRADGANNNSNALDHNYESHSLPQARRSTKHPCFGL
jgi:hypothetical protein